MNDKGEIVVQPHQVDGLSFSMTLVYLILNLRYFLKESIKVVVMGATGKGKPQLPH